MWDNPMNHSKPLHEQHIITSASTRVFVEFCFHFLFSAKMLQIISLNRPLPRSMIVSMRKQLPYASQRVYSMPTGTCSSALMFFKNPKCHFYFFAILSQTAPDSVYVMSILLNLPSSNYAAIGTASDMSPNFQL
jgi:hypothetical protein